MLPRRPTPSSYFSQQLLERLQSTRMRVMVESMPALSIENRLTIKGPKVNSNYADLTGDGITEYMQALIEET